MQVISRLDSKRKTIWLDLFRLGTSLNARCCLNVRFLVERGYGGTIYICRTLFPPARAGAGRASSSAPRLPFVSLHR